MQRTVVTLTCDVHATGGKPDVTAETTSNLIIDGNEYEIDTCTQHAKALAAAITPFIDAARKVGTVRKSAQPTKRDRNHTREVRTWAKELGFQMSNRGRIPAEIERKYDIAHGK